jgi:hypothetical protein
MALAEAAAAKKEAEFEQIIDRFRKDDATSKTT